MSHHYNNVPHLQQAGTSQSACGTLLLLERCAHLHDVKACQTGLTLKHTQTAHACNYGTCMAGVEVYLQRLATSMKKLCTGPAGAHCMKVADTNIRVCSRVSIHRATSVNAPRAVSEKARSVPFVILYSPRTCAMLQPCTACLRF